MDFTREPIIETIITPKEGCKLVVRSSKAAGQEEYFVDALEIVAFGNAIFFRSLDRSKAFIVPASDYEILEVREAKMVLKNIGIEKSIKIGSKPPKETPAKRMEPVSVAIEEETSPVVESKPEGKSDRKRDRRRQTRRRRGGVSETEVENVETDVKVSDVSNASNTLEQPEPGALPTVPVSRPKPLLPPPETLISETIARYRNDALFQGAFYIKKDEAEAETTAEESSPPFTEESFKNHDDLMDPLDLQNVVLEPPLFGSFGLLEEETEGYQVHHEVETQDLHKNERNSESKESIE